MKNNLRRWKKDKKRREEFLKSKNIAKQTSDELTENDKGLGINHTILMVGMVIVALGFIFFRMN